MSKNIFVKLFAIGFLLLACFAHEVRAQTFLPGMSDVPLMQELFLLDDSGYQFDKLEGRIIEKQAAGQVDPSEIRRFYDETLPQLGWVKQNHHYIRQNEKLSIKIENKDDISVVTFYIQPQ